MYFILYNNKKIRVLIIDDSMVFRAAIAKGIGADPAIEVVGMAADPYEAREKILELRPDICTIDCEMPRMNGVEFLRKVIPQYPLRAIMVSSLSGIVFDALNAGSLDFVSKPSPGPDNFQNFIHELTEKLKIGATIDMDKRMRQVPAANAAPLRTHVSSGFTYKGFIAIGASTGGTEATASILKALPGDVPGIVITQHMPPLFTKMYADRLDSSCAMTVREARDGDAIAKGIAYVAPGDMHLTVKKAGNTYYCQCKPGPKVNGHCPSVDMLFDSVAKVAPGRAVGVILTGMGGDGAKGLLAMKKTGCYTIGQDEKSSVVYGMPAVAHNLGAVTKQHSLDSIPNALVTYLKSNT